jgi:hypothetical protein
MSAVDGMSLRGAERLARKIEAYWSSRGHTVQTIVVPENAVDDNATGTGIWVVRSSLVNGMPR